MTTPIPSPPSLPLLGHVTQIEKEVPQRSFELLADQYGEIYQLNMISKLHSLPPSLTWQDIDLDCLINVVADRTTIIASSYELQNELSNEKRFQKAVVAGLVEVRNGLGDGLFTVSLMILGRALRTLPKKLAL